jgi:hypothetical protein
MNNIFINKSYKAFNFDWFIKNQSKILFLLNNKTTKRIARNIFGVNDVFDNNICVLYISPQEIKGYLHDNRTHYKTYMNWRFSMSVYQNMKILWQLIHFWDIKIANKFFPSLNFGFDDLEDSGPELTILKRASAGSPFITDSVTKYTFTQLRDLFNDVVVEDGASNQVWDINLHLKNDWVYPSKYTYMSRVLMAFNAYSLNTVDIENSYIELELQNWWYPGAPPVTSPPVGGVDLFQFVISCVPDQSTARPFYAVPDLDDSGDFQTSYFAATSTNKAAAVLSFNDYYNLAQEAQMIGGALTFLHKFYLTNDAIQFLLDYSFPVFGISTSYDRTNITPDQSYPGGGAPSWFMNNMRIKFSNVAISVIYAGGSDQYMQIVMIQ